MTKQTYLDAIQDWKESLEKLLPMNEQIKTFDNPPQDIDQRIANIKEGIDFLSKLKFIDILDLIKDKLQVHEQDGFYWVQISNDPMIKITKEQYDMVKEWLNG